MINKPCTDENIFIKNIKPCVIKVFSSIKLDELYKSDINALADVFVDCLMHQLMFDGANKTSAENLCFNAFLPVFTYTDEGLKNYPDHEAEIPKLLAKELLTPMQNMGYCCN